jgi:hypothetical protein
MRLKVVAVATFAAMAVSCSFDGQALPSTATKPPSQPQVTRPGSTATDFPTNWLDCLSPTPDALVELIPFGDWIRLVDGLVELSSQQLSELLARNLRDDLGNLIITPADGLLLVAEVEGDIDLLNSALLPEMDERLQQAAAVRATILVPMTREPGAGEGSRTVLAFMPDGRQVPLDGCYAGWYQAVPDWRNQEAPGLSDLEAWRAIVRPGSVERESFDAWWIERS